MGSITWDDTVRLIGAGEVVEDEIGQQTMVPRVTEVMCRREEINRTEFYKAGQNGIEVSEMLIVHPYEYNGEKLIEFNEKKLTVLKTYKRNMEELELTCTERIGDK